MAQAPEFDGRPWNVSTGNLSVTFIQGSPIGAFPKENYFEAPPAQEVFANQKRLGLVANEDYIAWGAVERTPGQWDFRQHDAMEAALHKAGLKYVAYTWVHFPPKWLRDDPQKRTLMRCMEHDEETNYLSVYDPRTIEWYDHFYKNLHAHFGDRIDDVYACILGPYGEGNYPLRVPDWVDMGHCHEAYWCADPQAIAAFRAAMQKKYPDIAALNKAWSTNLKSFDEVTPPAELREPGFQPNPAAFPTAHDKRRWLDFLDWYHWAIIDFAEQSVKTVLKYYPPEKVRTKPGGSAGGVNPIAWGTYCPGYAKMAKGLGIVLQPADCQGAVFADKWMGTAYQFYGVKECTEPATSLDDRTFVRRMFSDAASGAAEFFTYDFERHAPVMQQYLQLFTGKQGDTQVAVYCPTTFYRLGGNLHPTIQASAALRDLTDFDVLDELLINDGALTSDRYKALVIFQADIAEQEMLDRFVEFQRAGGKVIVVDAPIKNVAGEAWQIPAEFTKLPPIKDDGAWLKGLAEQLPAGSCQGVDGLLDGIWTCRRGNQSFAYNTTTNPVKTQVAGKEAEIPANTIYISNASN